MIVLHHLNKSRSQRIIWLLEELGLPYQIKAYQRDATSFLAPPSSRPSTPSASHPSSSSTAAYWPNPAPSPST